MVHRRSRVGILKRMAGDLITRNARFDRVHWEMVSTLNREDLVRILSERFRGVKPSMGGIPLSAIPDVERGEVLIDARGDGSLQRLREG